MGVPVVCLAGKGMVGRLSASILEGAGLSAAIAEDINQYKSLANLLAKVGPRDNAQRVALREKVKLQRTYRCKITCKPHGGYLSKMLGTVG